MGVHGVLDFHFGQGLEATFWSTDDQAAVFPLSCVLCWILHVDGSLYGEICRLCVLILHVEIA